MKAFAVGNFFYMQVPMYTKEVCITMNIIQCRLLPPGRRKKILSFASFLRQFAIWRCLLLFMFTIYSNWANITAYDINKILYKSRKSKRINYVSCCTSVSGNAINMGFYQGLLKGNNERFLKQWLWLSFCMEDWGCSLGCLMLETLLSIIPVRGDIRIAVTYLFIPGCV